MDISAFDCYIVQFSMFKYISQLEKRKICFIVIMYVRCERHVQSKTDCADEQRVSPHLSSLSLVI
jgi:hypothetical protein